MAPGLLFFPDHIEQLLRLEVVFQDHIAAAPAMKGGPALAQNGDHLILAGVRVAAAGKFVDGLVELGNRKDISLGWMGADGVLDLALIGCRKCWFKVIEDQVRRYEILSQARVEVLQIFCRTG